MKDSMQIFKIYHPHNQKMLFFIIGKNNFNAHFRVEEGSVCHLLLEIAH